MSSTIYKHFHKDDIKDYGGLIAIIIEQPAVYALFATFKREHEARDRQDRRHLAYFVFPEDFTEQYNPMDSILEKEKYTKLIASFDELTKNQKRRLFLRFWYELTYEQIAEIENISRTAVTKSIMQACKKMRNFMV